MKNYSVSLDFGWTVYLEADGYVDGERMLQFYVKSPDNFVAAYARSSISSVTETDFPALRPPVTVSMKELATGLKSELDRDGERA